MKTIDIAHKEELLINLPNGEVLHLNWIDKDLYVDHRIKRGEDSQGVLRVDDAATKPTPIERGIYVWDPKYTTFEKAYSQWIDDCILSQSTQDNRFKLAKSYNLDSFRDINSMCEISGLECKAYAGGGREVTL